MDTLIILIACSVGGYLISLPIMRALNIGFAKARSVGDRHTHHRLPRTERRAGPKAAAIGRTHSRSAT